MKERSTKGNASGVDAFVESARAYCSLIERRAEVSRSELVSSARVLLADLHARASSLPNQKLGESPTSRKIGNEGWWRLFESLRNQLREYDSFWVEHPESDVPSAPGESSLADDLADVYRELKDGLMAWDSTEPTLRAGAVWEWRFGFEVHWGDHAVKAMRAIHRIRPEPTAQEPRQDV
jgi:Domain of unknown function (DUF5063)